MKLYTLDKTILMEVSKISTHKEGIVLEGTIMGAMPLKALLRPAELRTGLRLVSIKLIWTAIKMLVVGRT